MSFFRSVGSAAPGAVIEDITQTAATIRSAPATTPAGVEVRAVGAPSWTSRGTQTLPHVITGLTATTNYEARLKLTTAAVTFRAAPPLLGTELTLAGAVLTLSGQNLTFSP